jgi:phosphoribosylaminoimidazolecarboxamide formyltransferase / IMP cyclohydrolase
MLPTRRVLMSCANKHNLDKLWKGLTKSNAINFDGFTSCGTYNYLKSKIPNDIETVSQIDQLTGFPEILGGKVKTLHPNIFGGILYNTESTSDCEDLDTHNINPIDIVCVNLYNVEEQLQKFYDSNNVTSYYWTHNIDEHPVLSHTDIGGSALLRAACKNYSQVLPLVDPEDYDMIIERLNNNSYSNTGNVFFELDERKALAAKAFDHVTCHDMMVSQYLNKSNIIYKKYTVAFPLKYGCNSTQTANVMQISKDGCHSVNQPLPFVVRNGDISYINVLDAVLSWNCVHTISELTDHDGTVTASFKHNSPAGIAFNNVGDTFEDTSSLFLARNCDSLSSFGDFIAHSGIVDDFMAKYLKTQVSDGIIASGFTPEALEILGGKKDGKYVILEVNDNELVKHSATYKQNTNEYRELYGLALQQEQFSEFDMEDIMDVLAENVNPLYLEDAYIGTLALNFIPSNSVTFTFDGQVVGIGCGQQSRVDCIRLAGSKARQWARKNGIDLNEPQNQRLFVMSSDGFLPFEDNIEVAKEYNVGLIIQPGGSIRDDKVQVACNKAGIHMIKTGVRLFTH